MQDEQIEADESNETEQPTELTPLLRRRQNVVPTSFPWFQILVLMTCLLVEPITATSIAPYINKRVGELDVTGGDERKVGYYVGLIQSMYHLSEAITIFHWGRLSDRIGRRPVLIIGLLGIVISMLLFGLSRSFLSLIVSRCLYGLLNGNSGIIKSTIGEITSLDSSNMVRAFALHPIVWAVGCTAGPFIGGQFADPAERFPNLFGGKAFWEKFPYFLPCFVVAGLALMSSVVVYLFLEETVDMDQSSRQTNKPRRLLSREVLTPQVIAAALSYGYLALLDLAYSVLQPLFYSTKIELGGLGFSVPQIGMALGLSSIWVGIISGLLFSPVHNIFGTRPVYMAGLFTFVPMLALFPIMNLFARYLGNGMVTMSALVLQLGLYPIADMSYSCVCLYINAAAPDKTLLGETNGIAQLLVSVVRAITPVASTSLFAITMERHLMGGLFVYVILILFCFAALRAASSLPRNAISSPTL